MGFLSYTMVFILASSIDLKRHSFVNARRLQLGLGTPGSSTTSEILNTEEEINLYLQCSVNSRYFRKHCASITMSCQGRCGSFLMKQVDKPMENVYMCSCDDMCTVYDDCCFDYEEKCSGMARRYKQFLSRFPRLHSAKRECFNGVALLFIDETDKNFAKYNFDIKTNVLKRTDYRKPVVSVEGLQFKNETTFLYIFQGNKWMKTAVTWKKSLNFVYPEEFQNVNNFWLYGNASELFQSAIEDVAPFNIQRRLCPPDLGQVKCPSCPDIKFIQNSVGLCDRSPNFPTTSTISTSWEISSTSLALEWHNLTGPIPSSNSSLIIEDETNQCKAMYIYTKSDGRWTSSILFSIIMSMSLSGEVKLELSGDMNFMNKVRWQGLDYAEVTDENRRELIIICHSGYLFNKKHCVPPKSLRIHSVIDSNISNLTIYADTIITEIVKGCRRIGLNVNQSNPLIYKVQYPAKGKQSKGLIVTVDFSIEKYNQTYDGKRLPMINQLWETINMLHQTLSKLPNVKNYQIFICLIAPATKSVDNATVTFHGVTLSICDHFTWNGISLRVRHIRMNERQTSIDEIATQTALSFTDNKIQLQSKASTLWKSNFTVTFLKTILTLLACHFLIHKF